jgi:hypothetical protein
MEPWFRAPKNPNGKSFDDGANQLPPFLPLPLPRTCFRPIPGCGPHYSEPLPRPIDDRYGLKLSSHFLLFERKAVPLELRFLSGERCSGVLSDVAPQCDIDTTEAPIPLVDDSATESRDELQNPSSAQSRSRQILRSLLPRP